MRNATAIGNVTMAAMAAALVAAMGLAAPGCRGREAARARPAASEAAAEAPAERDPNEVRVVRLRPEASARGIRLDRAVRSMEAGVPAVRLDLVFDRPYHGAIFLFALDARGAEVGRARLDLDATAGPRSVVLLLDRPVKLDAVAAVEITG